MKLGKKIKVQNFQVENWAGVSYPSDTFVGLKGRRVFLLCFVNKKSEKRLIARCILVPRF